MSEESSAPFEDSEVAKNTLFDLLSSPRRRFILYYLHEHSNETTLQDLADEVGAWEYDKAVDELTRQERKRVYVSLYQTHIPKLAESGIIEYDMDSGQITLTDNVNEFGPYLGWEDRVRPWQAMYIGLAVTGILFYGLVVFNIGPFEQLSDILAGAIVIVGFVILATWQYLAERQIAVDLPSELVENR